MTALQDVSRSDSMSSKGELVRDENALTLDVPSRGDSIRDLRVLLDRLDRAGVEPDGLSLLTADLDDVFLTLTGQPKSTSMKGDQ